MEPVKRKNFKVGNYEYDSKINYYWLRIIDGYFNRINSYLEKFYKILYELSSKFNRI